MIKTYKFTHSDKSKVYLTSDTHFFHEKLVSQRGFKSVEEHNEALINNWNKSVKPEDTVIHLGDFVLGAGQNSEKVCEELFRKLNGTIVLLWGNHVAGIKQIYKKCINARYPYLDDDTEVYPIYWENKVVFVGNSILAHIKTPDVGKSEKQNHFVFCSHFGYRIWIDCQRDVLHACGHSHGSDPESNPDNFVAKRLDVGVDNFNYTPLVFDEYLSIMKKKNNPVLDHHTKDTNPSF